MLMRKELTDIEQTDSCHKPPIIVAIECNCVDILTLLINTSANVYHQTEKEKQP